VVHDTSYPSVGPLHIPPAQTPAGTDPRRHRPPPAQSPAARDRVVPRRECCVAGTPGAGQITEGGTFPASRIPRAVSTLSRRAPPTMKNTTSAKMAGR
jgi:hypothetical protein